LTDKSASDDEVDERLDKMKAQTPEHFVVYSILCAAGALDKETFKLLTNFEYPGPVETMARAAASSPVDSASSSTSTSSSGAAASATPPAVGAVASASVAPVAAAAATAAVVANTKTHPNTIFFNNGRSTFELQTRDSALTHLKKLVAVLIQYRRSALAVAAASGASSSSSSYYKPALAAINEGKVSGLGTLRAEHLVDVEHLANVLLFWLESKRRFDRDVALFNKGATKKLISVYSELLTAYAQLREASLDTLLLTGSGGGGGGGGDDDGMAIASTAEYNLRCDLEWLRKKISQRALVAPPQSSQSS